MSKSTWISPDGKIKKTIISIGDLDGKPTEGSECKLDVIKSTCDLSTYSTLVIGDSDTDLGRLLDICASTMFKKEVADFVVVLPNDEVSFTIGLLDFECDGFIYQWDAKKKFACASYHKSKGVELFAKNEIREAGFRFNKALKIMSSVPIDVEMRPTVIDGVQVKDIEALKANLFNNLASCFFKKREWLIVIDLCKKVFAYDEENVKALYKCGVAHFEDHNFESADRCLDKSLQIEPNNKAILEYSRLVKLKLKESKSKCDSMITKMFSNKLKS